MLCNQHDPRSQVSPAELFGCEVKSFSANQASETFTYANDDSTSSPAGRTSAADAKHQHHDLNAGAPDDRTCRRFNPDNNPKHVTVTSNAPRYYHDHRTVMANSGRPVQGYEV
jgi:hypothetical protein